MNLNLREKIAGLLYGYAIGDALGLGTELMTREIAIKKYPDLLTDYSQIIRDAYRSQWQRGEWSSDTDYMLLLIDSVCDREGIDHLDFSTRLHHWYHTHHDEIPSHLRWEFTQPDFSSHPFEVSKRIWQGMNTDMSPSDALGRAMIIGLWDEDISQNALDNCRLTHPLPRCEASAVIMANLVNSILWKDEELSYSAIRSMMKRLSSECVDFIDSAKYGTLSDFDLGDLETYWWVRKALGVSLWALWHCTSPTDALIKIVNEGGDANTNASLAIGLLGLKYGIGSIDRKYIEGLLGAERIEAAVDKLSTLLTKRFLKNESLD